MATLTKGKTFTSGETVTPTKLHELVDLGTVTNIVDADIGSGAAIALSKLATGALPTAITTTTANIVDASVTPAKLSQPPTFATAQASTSGTSIDFTGIPSWAKKITVMFNGVSTSGSSSVEVRVGSGSIVSSGYASVGTYLGSDEVARTSSSSTGFRIDRFGSSADIRTGIATIINISGNAWVFASVGASGVYATTTLGGGSISLSGPLDRVRVTTVGGSDTFDAGTINIAYE